LAFAQPGSVCTGNNNVSPNEALLVVSSVPKLQAQNRRKAASYICFLHISAEQLHRFEVIGRHCLWDKTSVDEAYCLLVQ